MRGGLPPPSPSAPAHADHAWIDAVVPCRAPGGTSACAADLGLGGYMHAAAAPLCTQPAAARWDAGDGVDIAQSASDLRDLTRATRSRVAFSQGACQTQSASCRVQGTRCLADGAGEAVRGVCAWSPSGY